SSRSWSRRPEAERRLLVRVEPVHAALDLGGEAPPLEAKRPLVERRVERAHALLPHVLERLPEGLHEVRDEVRHGALVDDGPGDSLRDLDLPVVGLRDVTLLAP